jgi:hypothetical protein
MSGAHAGSPGENIAVLDSKIGTASSTPLASGQVSFKAFGKLMFILTTRDMAAETLDFKVVACDSNGANDADITGKAITQLAANASNNDDKVVVICVDEADMPQSATLTFVQAIATTGGATGGTVCITTLGTHFNGPASGVDSTAVLQIVP